MSRILLGRAYLGLGRYADAEAKLSTPGPASAEPARLEGLSRVAEGRGDLDRAISMMTEAVEARRKLVPVPDDPDGASLLANSQSSLGQLAFRAGRLDLAKDQFQKAIALVSEAHAKLHELDVPHDERDPRLYAGGATSGLARVYAAQGNAVRADRSWRGVTARTDDPEILAALAAFYRARGDEKSARRHLDRALSLTAGKPAHRRIRALLLADVKATQDEALALAEAAHADAPDLSSIDTLAWVFHLRGDDRRAAEVLASAIRLGTKDPTILYHAGMIARARGKADEAKRHLTGSLELNPAFDPIAAPDARRALDELR
ncbi:thioredoxin [Isosphaeraceae bacterium EP7]